LRGIPLTELARLDVAAPSALLLDGDDAVCLVSDDEAALCPLAFTDAAPLPDGRLLFSAAAEAGGSTYHDGGSALGVLGPDGRAQIVGRFVPSLKIEGIAPTADGRLYAVADPDDPDARAPLHLAPLDV
jgi:hypothetical protein